jgi:GNAT superfamily N-acetyltransferase
MKLRELHEEDLLELLDLYQHLHRNDEPLPNEEVVQKVWKRIQNNDGFLCIGGFVDENLVCSACLFTIDNLTRGCRPYALIENVVTHGSYRRKGFGQKVLQHCLNEAWSRNCYKVMLLTGRKDEGVYQFYESVGFNRHSKQAFIAKN